MKPTSDPSPAPSPAPTSAAPIIYFDATVRRKEKMKLLARRGGRIAELAPDRPAEALVAENKLPETPWIATHAESTSAEYTINVGNDEEQMEPPLLPFVATAETASEPEVVLPVSQGEPAERLQTETLLAFAVNLIVEHTGYPPDLVDAQADLEADLGIDSITLVQLLSEIRDYTGVEPSTDMALGAFKTLSDVVRIFQESAAGTRQERTEASA